LETLKELAFYKGVQYSHSDILSKAMSLASFYAKL